MKILWSTLAIQNLDDIYDFHSTSSTQTAAKIYNLILDEVKRLETFPKLAASGETHSAYQISSDHH